MVVTVSVSILLFSHLPAQANSLRVSQTLFVNQRKSRHRMRLHRDAEAIN